ncbi:pyridoxamine 5'-phosphate oxidase family protein [Georgenia sp. 1P01AC]|uniref:pyridoxamine 5'-phosphate oxidase family protein n=1 Tax=Georgenia sp. 1P01AC TaxID=554103 RepID=UPI0039AF8F6B
MDTADAQLPQGDLRLLDAPLAQRLLHSTIPARLAYTARDGTPRVVPTWFHWTGEELVMATFLSAPHVAGPARRLPALRARPDVAVTIDTEAFPPEVLLVRGRVRIEGLDGVAPEYAAAARRYQGEEGGGQYLAFVDQPGTRIARISLRPSWVGLLDFQARSPGALASQ